MFRGRHSPNNAYEVKQSKEYGLKISVSETKVMRGAGIPITNLRVESKGLEEVAVTSAWAECEYATAISPRQSAAR